MDRTNETTLLIFVFLLAFILFIYCMTISMWFIIGAVFSGSMLLFLLVGND